MVRDCAPSPVWLQLLAGGRQSPCVEQHAANATPQPQRYDGFQSPSRNPEAERLGLIGCVGVGA